MCAARRGAADGAARSTLLGVPSRRRPVEIVAEGCRDQSLARPVAFDLRVRTAPAPSRQARVDSAVRPRSVIVTSPPSLLRRARLRVVPGSAYLTRAANGGAVRDEFRVSARSPPRRSPGLWWCPTAIPTVPALNQAGRAQSVVREHRSRPGSPPRLDAARRETSERPRPCSDLAKPAQAVSAPISRAESACSMPSTAAPASPAYSPSTLAASTRFRVANGSARW